MKHSVLNHYATLGLDRGCTGEQIRAAYRAFAKQHHPDLNPSSREAVARTQAINAAYEILSDPAQRQIYDAELPYADKVVRSRVSSVANLSQELLLPLAEFFRGTTREVHINDPGNTNGREVYDLTIPPATAPGTRLRFRRANGGFVTVHVKPFPHYQFKVRGSDLRCDLKINSKLAAQGGEQMIKGVLGSMLRVKIPARVARNEIVRLEGEGMPKPRGGRGDLLVRIVYRPEIRIVRTRRP